MHNPHKKITGRRRLRHAFVTNHLAASLAASGGASGKSVPYVSPALPAPTGASGEISSSCASLAPPWRRRAFALGWLWPSLRLLRLLQDASTPALVTAVVVPSPGPAAAPVPVPQPLTPFAQPAHPPVTAAQLLRLRAPASEDERRAAFHVGKEESADPRSMEPRRTRVGEREKKENKWRARVRVPRMLKGTGGIEKETVAKTKRTSNKSWLWN